jgi:hypothetical protein
MLPSTMKTAPERSGDPLFGVVSGLYLALLVVPLVVFAVGRVVTADAAGRYVTAVVTAAVVLGLGWLTTERIDGLAPGIGATRLRWALAAFPVGYALAGFASLEQTGSVGAVAFFFGIGAMAVGFVLGVMARTRHADAVLADVERECEFRAGWPEAARRRLMFAAGAATVVAVLCVGVGILTDRFWLQSVGQILFPVGVVSYTSAEPRTFTVSEAGLEQRLPVARRLVSWNVFEGYSRTEDAIVLHRRFRVDTRFALADIDDPETVETAIARHLQAA